MFALFDKVLAACAGVACALLAAITLAICLNVALRNLGLPVIYGTLDGVEYALMLATFLGAPWVLALRAHVQVDLLTNSLGPRGHRALERVIAALGCALCLGFAWFGLQSLLASMARGSMIRTSFVFPEWWTLAVIPLSLLLCAVEFLRQLLHPSQQTRQKTGI